MKKLLKKAINISLPLVLSGFILYGVYGRFDFGQLHAALWGQMDWGWMMASLCFGVLAQFFRGLRWKQALAPLGFRPRTSYTTYAIFLSYAVSLVVPRLGEVSRCGLLAKYEQVPFAKGLGTVVIERCIDIVTLLALTLLTIYFNPSFFSQLLQSTGTKVETLSGLLSSVWLYVGIGMGIGLLFLLYRIRWVRDFMKHLYEGVVSLRKVDSIPLFVFYTLAIWGSYFLHFYLTFYCFEFTSHLGLVSALLLFVGGTLAVIIPTPNGAGAWHFIVIVMLSMLGVAGNQAATFALIVHTIQTLLIVALGLYAIAALGYQKAFRPTISTHSPEQTQ